MTIPRAVRESLGLVPGTEVEVLAEGEGVRIVNVREPGRPGRGASVVTRLRRNGVYVSMSTDEIMALTRDKS